MRVKLFARRAVDRMQWVEFPMGTPHIDSDGLKLLEQIATATGQSKPGKLLIADLDSPIRNLKQYVLQDADLEQLNTLAIKIGYMGPEEQVCFEAALDLNSVMGMDDILRLSDSLDQYEMLLDVSSMTELDAGRPQVFKVHLYTSKVGDTMPGPYRLTLPACGERLEQVQKCIGVDDFAQARIEQVEYPLTDLQVFLSNADCPSVETLNALAEEVEALLQMDGQLLKLCGVLEAEQPQTMDEALHITQNLDDYERVPCGSTLAEYGSYVVAHSDEWFDYDELLEDLQGFIDEAGYGEYRMREDGVRATDFGLIRRLSEPFPAQENGMALRQG